MPKPPRVPARQPPKRKKYIGRGSPQVAAKKNEKSESVGGPRKEGEKGGRPRATTSKAKAAIHSHPRNRQEQPPAAHCA